MYLKIHHTALQQKWYFVTTFRLIFLKIATEFADCDKKWSVEIHFVTEIFNWLTFNRKIFW